MIWSERKKKGQMLSRAKQRKNKTVCFSFTDVEWYSIAAILSICFGNLLKPICIFQRGKRLKLNATKVRYSCFLVTFPDALFPCAVWNTHHFFSSSICFPSNYQNSKDAFIFFKAPHMLQSFTETSLIFLTYH